MANQKILKSTKNENRLPKWSGEKSLLVVCGDYEGLWNKHSDYVNKTIMQICY